MSFMCVANSRRWQGLATDTEATGSYSFRIVALNLEISPIGQLLGYPGS